MGPTFERGDRVRHARFGAGRVELDTALTVIVRFEHGLEECEKASLMPILTLFKALQLAEWYAPAAVISRIQAEAIQSVNDTWGVFSRSRIALLPHQLWVCRHVLERWPARWLIADDVGLGKTIEAGLILWPVLAKNTVKRLLLLCPAALVDQWQYRLRHMFDIRMTRYSTEADTPRADFWGTHNQVIASLQTMRADGNGRQARLLESDPWDLLIVDEAHHLNADEQAGPTLGYRFIERLVKENRVASVLFFTGTPHRGKNFGFLALLRLLREDLFDPRRSLREQLPHLREVMIRNNKQNVTDLRGQRLFQPPLVSTETYAYSPAESDFYAKLTDFILQGKAYASSINPSDARTVILVLIAMQKLASSSVAAVARALRGRLSRLVEARQRLDQLQSELQERRASLASRYEELEGSGEGDGLSDLEEQIVELTATARLMEDEEPQLRELVAAAEQVDQETKIKQIIRILETRFAERQVLLFTEYKATQSLVMSALIQRFGDGCTGFINGDDRAEEVVNERGARTTMFESRELAAEKFNNGMYRFLVSTEAGGEGIDLQERCHSLVHIDLPWNPMRLHQRVGRLNRYGQTKQVEVISLHNPQTVESLIWDKLNHKIGNIMLALSQVMDEPEDLLQLVLGMTSPSLFREIFSDAPAIPRESLADWFDTKTARFSGRDVIEVVRSMVGNCTRFDFQQIAPELPRVDLPDLAPFFKTMLTLNGRKFREDESGLSFRTPEAWSEPGTRPGYDRLIFSRDDRSKDAAQRVLGVGHKAIDQAILQAKTSEANVATLPDGVLKSPLLVFRISDRLTTEGGTVRSVIVGVDWRSPTDHDILRDWEVLRRLNEILGGRGIRRPKSSRKPDDLDQIPIVLEQTQQLIDQRKSDFDLPFVVPQAEVLAILWPLPAGKSEPTDVSLEDEDSGF